MGKSIKLTYCQAADVFKLTLTYNTPREREGMWHLTYWEKWSDFCVIVSQIKDHDYTSVSAYFNGQCYWLIFSIFPVIGD